MPRRPNTPCKHPGCGKLVPYGRDYCDDHTPVHRHDVKSTKGERLRKTLAKKLAERSSKTHPLCVKCQSEGKLVPATVVDHIVPHRGDPHLFWDEGNWQPLCKSCHDTKTMTEDRYQDFKY